MINIKLPLLLGTGKTNMPVITDLFLLRRLLIAGKSDNAKNEMINRLLKSLVDNVGVDNFYVGTVNAKSVGKAPKNVQQIQYPTLSGRMVTVRMQLVFVYNLISDRCVEYNSNDRPIVFIVCLPETFTPEERNILHDILLYGPAVGIYFIVMVKNMRGITKDLRFLLRNRICFYDTKYRSRITLGTEIANTLSPTKNDMWFLTGDNKPEHILWQL